PPNPLLGHLGVHLGGRNRGVAQKLLHYSYIGPMIEHVGGTRVPQHVRAEFSTQTNSVAIRPYDCPRPLPAEATAPSVQKNGLGIAPPGPSGAYQFGSASGIEPNVEGIARHSTHRHYSLFGALPHRSE